jgi:hypothetical protein
MIQLEPRLSFSGQSKVHHGTVNYVFLPLGLMCLNENQVHYLFEAQTDVLANFELATFKAHL